MSSVKFSKFAARNGATLACDKCGTNIAKGQTYRWAQVGWGGRKISRCMSCEIRRSETTTSKLAAVYAATEDAEDQLNTINVSNAEVLASLVDDINSILGQCGDAWREVAEEYGDAVDAVGEAFGEQMQTRLESIESAADELDTWSADSDEPDTCDEHSDRDDECQDCQNLGEEWAREVIDSALSSLSDAESSIE